MKRQQFGEALCSVVGLFYSYGIVGWKEGKVIVDEDSVLAACKKLGIDLKVCIDSLNVLRNKLGFEKILAAKLYNGEIIVEKDPEMLAKRLTDRMSAFVKTRKGAQKGTSLRRIDDMLSIWNRIRWYYTVDENKLLEYWLSEGLECGASLALQSSKHACLALAGLLVKDDIPWSTFERLIANLLHFGLEKCYMMHVEYGVDNDAIDILLVREQQCPSHPYELIVVEVKSRSKHKLLARGGERDPVAQLRRYIEKIVEMYPNRRTILGLLVTNGFAARRLLIDFISEAQKFKDEANRHGFNVRLDIIDFLILYEVLEECSREGYAVPPAEILYKLLRKKVSFAKKLLEDYEPPRTDEEAIKMYEKYRKRVEKHVREALGLK